MPHQTWDPNLYDQEHSFVWRLAEEILAWLDPQPGERIVDLGCGTGHLTARIGAAGAAVVGIDRSAEMIAAARGAYPSLEFQEGDARTFAVDGPVDAVFSNATLHWIPEADQVAGRVSAALRPGGRFVAEFGGHGNVDAIADAARSVLEPHGRFAWPSQYYPTPDAYSQVLEDSGLQVMRSELVERPTPLPAGLAGWLQMFRGEILDSLPTGEVSSVIAAIEEAARPTLFRMGRWFADYVRLRIEARKP